MAPPASATEMNLAPKDSVRFCINGTSYVLDRTVPATTTLLQFIRERASLPGTKALCYEGGCGACTVAVSAYDQETDDIKSFSVRACQTLVYSCAGWAVRTIEHLGNRYQGYSRHQTALRGFSGTQCGYCTPGFVMTMIGQTESTKPEELKTREVERFFDGNICRCTGYRPILDAFKSFAADAPESLTSRLADIEDACKLRCPKSGQECDGHCSGENEAACSKGAFDPAETISLSQDGIKWYRPKTLQEIYGVLKTRNSSEKIRFVVGNTAGGVYKNEGPYDYYIDTSGVRDLYVVQSGVTLGANVCLQRCIEVFRQSALHEKGYHHLEAVAKHWEHVANTGIRNVASWAGNLMMKHAHPEFCSDLYLTLVAVEATLKIGSASSTIEMSVEDFMSTDMSESLILSMSIPPQPKNVKVRTFKITPRAVNTHAYVNAAFKFHIDPTDGLRIINMPVIAFGGINPSFTHAKKTERFFVGRQLTSTVDVAEAIKTLATEIEPDSHPHDASPEYRKSLCQSLLYKTILGLLGKDAKSHVQIGGMNLERPVSSGKQTFDANQDTWPIGQAMPKLEAEQQISGEAEYLDDMAPLPGELYGAFVQSAIARGKIKSVSATKCLNIPGVVDFVTVQDIPGKNNFTPMNEFQDPVFADSDVQYAGQSIGLVIATSKTIAKEAARLVEVVYEDVLTPVLTIEDSIKTDRVKEATTSYSEPDGPITRGDAAEALSKAKHILEGELSQGSQFHFPIEPVAARVIPVEDGYDVYCTSQWPTAVQTTVASVLNIPANSINMTVRRIGGAFGSKISRPNIVAAAAAVAAHKVRKPVRVALDLTTHMTLLGWRDPYYSKYQVAFSDDGVLEAVDVDIYSDAGFIGNESSSAFTAANLPNTYHCPNWRIQPYIALTDTAANTWCRTPGHPDVMATMENILEHIAHYLKKDPVEIREMNFSCESKPEVISSTKDNVVRSTIFPLLKEQSEYNGRKEKIRAFNKEHRWRKKGISMIPMRYAFQFFPFFQYNVQVAIYEHDGTVAIKHGGIEMGQGINTKVAQVAAKILGVPLDIIKIKPTDVFAGANSSVTGGSYGSDLNAYGTKICCERLRDRMHPVAKKMKQENGESTWVSLVKECFKEEVDLCERYFTVSKEHPKGYDIWGAACAEVEIDVLTGQHIVLRTDIMEDCGRSLSPYVDIGQIEGAFVMGLGFYTTEKVKFNPETGVKVSDGTWEYVPPSALDIPVDFRVCLMPRGDNPNGVVRSKATGEPALCLSYVVVTALREAIKAARADSGHYEWFDMDTPVTVERIHQLCNVDPPQFII